MPEATKESEKTPKIKKSRKIDLNKMRAARLENRGPAPVVLLGDQEFQCPPELPFAVIESFARMEAASKEEDGAGSTAALQDSVRALLRTKFDAFMALSPSTEDMVDFITAVFSEYGVTVGESEASPSS